MKMIKRLAILGLAVLCSLPVYGADEKEAEPLSLEKAISAGLSSCGEISVYSKKIDSYEEAIKYDNSRDYDYNDNMYQLQDSQLSQKLLKEAVAYEVEVAYDNLVITAKQIKHLGDSMTMTQKELKAAEIKKVQGAMDDLSYDKMAAELETTKEEKDKKEQDLKEAQEKFKILTGLTVANYTLEEDFTYEPFEIDSYPEAYIKGQVKKAYEYKEAAAVHYSNTVVDRLTPEDQYSTYLGYQATAKEKLENIDSSKDAAEKTLLNVYTSLVDGEKDIQTLQRNLRTAQKEAQVAEIKYKQGALSQLEYEKAKFNLEDLEMKLLTTIYTCKQQQLTLKTPWSTIGIV